MSPLKFTQVCNASEDLDRKSQATAIEDTVCFNMNDSNTIFNGRASSPTMAQQSLNTSLPKANSTSSPPTGTDHHTGALPTIALVLIIFLAIPIGTLYLLHRLRNWGRWKLRRENAPEYVRTWLGWVPRETYDRRLARRARFKAWKKRTPLWRSTKADYSWIYWDPTGDGRRGWEEKRERSWLRFLPSWVRSHPHGTIKWTRGTMATTRSSPSCLSRNIVMSVATSQLHGLDLSATFSGMDITPDESTGTVRRRRVSRPYLSEPVPSSAAISTSSFDSASSNIHPRPETLRSFIGTSNASERDLRHLQHTSTILETGTQDDVDNHSAPLSISAAFQHDTGIDSNDISPSSTPPHQPVNLHVPRKRISIASPSKHPPLHRHIIPSRSLPEPSPTPWASNMINGSIQPQRPHSWTAGDDAHFPYVSRYKSSSAVAMLPIQSRGLRRTRGDVGDRDVEMGYVWDEGGMGVKLEERIEGELEMGLDGYEDEDELDVEVGWRDVS